MKGCKSHGSHVFDMRSKKVGALYKSSDPLTKASVELDRRMSKVHSFRHKK